MWNYLIYDLKIHKVDVNINSKKIVIFKHIIFALIFYPGFACVFWYRFNRYLYQKKIPGAMLLGVIRQYIFSNDISYIAEIGPGLRLVHLIDIVIGGRVKIGRNVTIFNGVTIGFKEVNGGKSMPVIGNNVVLSTGSKIVGDIKIGNDVIVGALTLCNKSVPDNSVAYGIPAKIKIR